jgi:hypothetical protein
VNTWTVECADGRRSAPIYTDEMDAAATCALLDRNVPRCGPHRVVEARWSPPIEPPTFYRRGRHG